VFHQYYAERSRRIYPCTHKKLGRKMICYPDPRDKQIGTIPIGTILYIQDGINPLRGFTRPIVCREPWIVEAWLPREYAKWDGVSRTFKSVRIRGGHLALVRGLRTNRVQTVADWILLACVDAGLDWQLRQRTYVTQAKNIPSNAIPSRKQKAERTQ
jgi:hypothetical protein